MSAIKVRALYDFNSEYDNEMRHVLVGDVLTVLDKNVGDGWWKCCNLRTQEKGIIFPKKKNWFFFSHPFYNIFTGKFYREFLILHLF